MKAIKRTSIAAMCIGGWGIFLYADSETTPDRLAHFNAGGRLFIMGSLTFCAATFLEFRRKEKRQPEPRQ